MKTAATIVCPECGGRSKEFMPDDACLFFFQCPHCGSRLKPRPGDCCVFCSYGDLPCLPVQREREGVLAGPSER